MNSRYACMCAVRCTVFLAITTLQPTTVVAQPANLLTIEDAIQSARFVTDLNGNSVFFSPDSTQYAALTVKGDVARDRVELNVYAGSTASLAAARPRLVRTLVTDALPLPGPMVDIYTGGPALVNPGRNPPVWIGDHAIAFLWADKASHNQIFKLDLQTDELTQLTNESLDVIGFMETSSGAIVYDLKTPYPNASSDELKMDGYSVKNPDADMLLAGMADGAGMLDFTMCSRVLLIPQGGGYVRRSVANSAAKVDASALFWWGADIASPDGRRIILNVRVSEPPASWSGYTGRFATFLQGALENPHGFAAYSAMYQFYTLDLASGQSRLLWDAPEGQNPWSLVAWAPDSRHVFVGPTPLPLNKAADAGAREGYALAIVDADTGGFQRVTGDANAMARISSARWLDRDRILVGLRHGDTYLVERRGDGWRLAEKAYKAPPSPKKSADAPVVLHVVEDMNDPPVLVGVDSHSGRQATLLDANPDFTRKFALGRVELIHWRDRSGRPWSGRLYYPAGYEPGSRYPLVIQTHGYENRATFSLYGSGRASDPNLGPGWSVYLAQPLASYGIAVLQVGMADDELFEGSELESTHRAARGLADAARHLADIGLVDPTKVGIMGHSASGRMIEDALAFDEFPFAAAIADDDYEYTYGQNMELGWDPPQGTPAPFGAGLAEWLNCTPGFNAEHIRTPLQLEVTMGVGENSTLMRSWDLFSRLRYLKKPVEYFVLPDIRRGSHSVQNPRQVRIVQQRALDWWTFWLQGEEDADPNKALQYSDWRHLRALRDEDLAKPEAPRLVWSAVPTG